LIFKHHRGDLFFANGFSGKKLVCFRDRDSEKLLLLLVHLYVFLVLLFKYVVLKTFIPVLFDGHALIVPVYILSSKLTLDILLLLVNILEVLMQLGLAPFIPHELIFF